MRQQLITMAILILSPLAYATEVIKDGQDYPLDKLREQNQKIIKMVVAEVSKGLPQKVNKYTQMTKVRDENLTLIYTFEINAAPKSDDTVRKEGKEKMEKNVTKGICQSSKRFLDSGVTLTYEYISASTKKELFTFTMTQQKCHEQKEKEWKYE
ncbi:MAG: hypothetical protein KAG56_01715 [Sulfurovaceae bacterium]|nr:hypothetical protein [Sulfurovaceae bacterium]